MCQIHACIYQFLKHQYFLEYRFKCYEWTSADLIHIHQEGKSQKETCEKYDNFVFTEGDGRKAPGCGSCWCCQPEVRLGKSSSYNTNRPPKEKDAISTIREYLSFWFHLQIEDSSRF